MHYLGMNAATGQRIEGREHLAQSVAKILTTAVGTRLRRRSFGALAADLIDAPANGATVLQLYAAAATALLAWEPRLRVRALAASTNPERAGSLMLTIEGETATDAEPAPVTLTTALSPSLSP